MQEIKKIILTDPELGRREISLESYVPMIQDQLKLLKVFQRKKNTKEIQLDIKTYEYILNSSNPEELATLYLETKRKVRALVKWNHEVAFFLGWDIENKKH